MNFAEKFPNKEGLENFHEAEFEIEEKLKELKGPLIEIAGPTRKGYELVDINNLDKKIFISNRNNPVQWGKIDFIGDARKLPIKDNSVSALFVSAIGSPQNDSSEEYKQLRKKVMGEGRNPNENEIEKFIELSKSEFRKLKNQAIKEASRVIENGGLLIWQAGDKEDIVFAEGLGFVKKVIQNTLDRRVLETPKQQGYSIYDCIFEKVLLKEGK